MSRVLITGTSSGFGRDMVSALLARGHEVVATLRDADTRQDLFARELSQYGQQLRTMSLDVTSANERAQVVAALDGKVDALVNNAGYALFGALEDMTEAQLRMQLEVNFMGAALLTQGLLPALRLSRGALINVSSVFGYSAFPLTAAYCASKYALEGLSEALYHELRPHGVRVHLIEPGGHRTEFGSSIDWAANTHPPYASQTAAYHGLREKLESKPGRPTTAVVDCVIRLVERPSRRLRIPIGPDALLTAAFKRLPDRVSTPMTALLMDRLFPVEGQS